MNIFPKNFQCWMPQDLIQFNTDYLETIKNQPGILLPLFACVIQDKDFWEAQTHELKNKLVIIIYEMQCKKKEEGVKLETIEKVKKISPAIYPQIKQIIKDYEFIKKINLLIDLINNKSDILLLDKANVYKLVKDKSHLLPFLIAENNDKKICIKKIINIINKLEIDKIDIELLPYFLKLAQECDKEVFLVFNEKEFCLLNASRPNNTINVIYNSIESNKITITLFNHTDIEERLKTFINIFEHLEMSLEINFVYDLTDPMSLRNKTTDFINKFKKYIKGMFFIEAKASGRTTIHKLENLIFF